MSQNSCRTPTWIHSFNFLHTCNHIKIFKYNCNTEQSNNVVQIIFFPLPYNDKELVPKFVLALAFPTVTMNFQTPASDRAPQQFFEIFFSSKASVQTSRHLAITISSQFYPSSHHHAGETQRSFASKWNHFSKPPVCRCNLQALVRISMTSENPGR